MSENSKNQNDNNLSSDKSKDAELEDLISSVMAKKKSQQAEQSAEEKQSDENVTADKSSVGDIPDLKLKAMPVSSQVTVSSNVKKPQNRSAKADDHMVKKSASQSGGKDGLVKKESTAKSDAEKTNSATAKKASEESKKKASADKAETAASGEKSDKKKKNKWSAKKKTGVTLGIIFIVFVLLLAGIVALFFHYTGLLNRSGDNRKNYSQMPISDSDLTSGDDTFDEKLREEELKKQLQKNAVKLSDEDVFNVLLIGEDVRDPAEQGRGNTDVMMIISINKKNKTITTTSLMRDMWVYLGEFDVNSKLNAAYWHGGSEYLEDIIEQYFGIEINRYVSVNFESFIKIVEAVGGLDFDVQENEAEAMKDPLDEVNDILKRKRGTGYVTAGQQHLDGYQSLAYARIRYNCGDDYGRTQRQRAVIAQIIQKSKKLSLLQLNDLLNEVLKQVTTDVTDGEIASMLLDAFEYMDYTIQEVQIPVNGYFTADIIYSQDVLSPNIDANAAILQKVIYGSATTAEEAAEEYEQELISGGAAQTYGEQNGYYDEYGNYVSY